jgi:hypothetical protein
LLISTFKKCMIKGRNSYPLCFDASELYQKWGKLQNVHHIYNVFEFICTFFYVFELNKAIYSNTKYSPVKHFDYYVLLYFYIFHK